MTYDLRSGVSSAETDSGVTLLDERSGEYFNLNPTGALVLRILLADGSAEQAVDRLMSEYDVDRGTADRDVAELVAALESSGLVVAG